MAVTISAAEPKTCRDSFLISIRNEKAGVVFTISCSGEIEGSLAKACSSNSLIVLRQGEWGFDRANACATGFPTRQGKSNSATILRSDFVIVPVAVATVYDKSI